MCGHLFCGRHPLRLSIHSRYTDSVGRVYCVAADLIICRWYGVGIPQAVGTCPEYYRRKFDCLAYDKDYNLIDLDISNFNTINVIQDDIIYRYLFDKLRKSLFLDQEFYKVPESKEAQILIQKDVTIIEKIVETKVKQDIEPKKFVKKCSTAKCEESSSLIFSVQFLCTTDKNIVQKEFEKLKNEGEDVRVHPYYEYQVLRLGRFKTRIEAENAMKRFKGNYPEISIVAFKPKR